MKKRIISLILVLATAFLTLTGCAFRYDKKDMSKYASFDKDAFYKALHALVIKDATFAPGGDRDGQVSDAIALELLDGTEVKKKLSGKVGLYDSLHFCYYAEDEDGNIFYGDMLNHAKPTGIQIGLSSVSGLNKAVADKILTIDNIADYIYTTSSTEIVKAGDVVSVSWYAAWDEDGNAENGKEKSEVVWNQYYTVKESGDEFSAKLIGTQVGVEKSFTATVKDGEVDREKDFANVKVEHIVRGAVDGEGHKIAQKVEDGSIVSLSYTLSFKATPFFNTTTNKHELPEKFNGMDYEYKIEGGNVKITVTCDIREVEADLEGVAADAKTFLGQLVGKEASSTTSSITEKNVSFGGQTVDFNYSNVKVNWIFNNVNPIEVEYTEEAYEEAKNNKKTAKNVNGKEFQLNGKKLTYYVMPVYYVDVVDAFSEDKDIKEAVRLLLTKYYDVFDTEKTENEVKSYVFSALNDKEYKNGDNVLIDLIIDNNTSDDKDQLIKLGTTHSDKKKALNTALTSLKTAQKNLAETKHAAGEEAYKALETALSNAETAYKTAKGAEQTALALLNNKVTEILDCKKGETSVVDSLFADYKQYKYDALDAKYRADIKNNLSTAITEIVKNSITFDGKKLPKRAVKQAYNTIMDTYKQDFYEGKYSAGTNTNTTLVTETNYVHYKGDLNAYLIDKVLSGQEGGTMKEVKAAVKAKAEKSVQDIIRIYALVQMVEDAWGTDLLLTKQDKKDIKEGLEQSAYIYQQYYGVAPTFEDACYATQLDRVITFLLETTEITNADGVKVDSYTNISYTAN